jgi:hypothetical protein
MSAPAEAAIQRVIVFSPSWDGHPQTQTLPGSSGEAASADRTAVPIRTAIPTLIRKVRVWFFTTQL